MLFILQVSILSEQMVIYAITISFYFTSFKRSEFKDKTIPTPDSYHVQCHPAIVALVLCSPLGTSGRYRPWFTAVIHK